MDAHEKYRMNSLFNFSLPFLFWKYPKRHEIYKNQYFFLCFNFKEHFETSRFQ